MLTQFVIIYGLEQPLFQTGFVVDIWTHKCVNNVQTFKGLVHYLPCCSVLFKKRSEKRCNIQHVTRCNYPSPLNTSLHPLTPKHCSLLEQQSCLFSPQMPFFPLYNLLCFALSFVSIIFWLNFYCISKKKNHLCNNAFRQSLLSFND